MALNEHEKTRFSHLTRWLGRKDINVSLEIVKQGHEDRLQYSAHYSFIRDIALLASEEKYHNELKGKLTDVQISECVRIWHEKEKPEVKQKGVQLFKRTEAVVFDKKQFEELFERLFPGHKMTPRNK